MFGNVLFLLSVLKPFYMEWKVKVWGRRGVIQRDFFSTSENGFGGYWRKRGLYLDFVTFTAEICKLLLVEK